MKIDNILFDVLVLHWNESSELDLKTHKRFELLMIELTKIKYNIRYCNNVNCECHPETEIKRLICDNQLQIFLKNNNLYEQILSLLDNYAIKTIYDSKYFNKE